MTKSNTFITQLCCPKSGKKIKKINIEDCKPEEEPIRLEEPETFISSKLVSPKIKQTIFPEDNSEEANIFFRAMSFYFGGEDSIKQRVLCYVPLEIISITACVNYHLAFKFYCEYILKKFKVEYNPQDSLMNLYFKLPEKIHIDISKRVRFEPSCLLDIPNLDNLKDYIKNAENSFLDVQNFIVVTRKLKLISLNIHNNTFFL